MHWLCLKQHVDYPRSLSMFTRCVVGYIYATIANVVITLMSMFGIVLLLCTSCTSVFQLCIQFCISLAVGSLTGDALLHLLPMVRGFNLKLNLQICLNLYDDIKLENKTC